MGEFGDWKIEILSLVNETTGVASALDSPAGLSAGTSDKMYSLSFLDINVLDLSLVADSIVDQMHCCSGCKVHEKSWGDVGSDINLGSGSFGCGMLGGVTSVGMDVAVGVDGVSAGCGMNIDSVMLAR